MKLFKPLSLMSCFFALSISSTINAEGIKPFEVESDTVALWNFDKSEVSNSINFKDNGPNGYDLIQHENSTTPLEIVYSSSGLEKAVKGFSATTGPLVLDGNHNSSSADNKNLSTAAPLTFEAWVKWDNSTDLPKATSSALLKQSIASSNVGSSHAFWLYASQGKLVLTLPLTSDHTKAATISATIDPKEKKWYHVAFTIEKGEFDGQAGSDTRVKLYFNDANTASSKPQPLVNTYTPSAGEPSYNQSTFIFSNFNYDDTGWNFLLGKRYSGSNSSFLGLIDEVKISSSVKQSFETFNTMTPNYKADRSFVVFHEFRKSDDSHPKHSVLEDKYNIRFLPRLDRSRNKDDQQSHIFKGFWEGLNRYYDFPTRNNVRNLVEDLRVQAEKDQSTIEKDYQKFSENPFGYLDIEHLPQSWTKKWNHDGDKETTNIDITESDWHQTVKKLSAIADWLHAENPNLRFGYYGEVTQTDFHHTVDPNRNGKQIYVESIEKRNKIFSELANHVDVLFPIGYAFYDRNSDNWKGSIDTWIKYVTAKREETRKFNKPTYLFIWPRYHAAKDANDINQEIDGEFWRVQLETAYNLGFDGVVIWDNWSAPFNGDKNLQDSNDWLYQTIDFMNSKGLLPSNTSWPLAQPESQL